MTALLNTAAEWLYQLNPTLCKEPPRATDDEYCYMGPDGGTEGALFCKDIDYSMATCVGSWLLPPEHHIVEGVAVSIVALFILHRTIPKLYQVTDVPHLQIQHPVWARSASLFCFGMIMCYKYFGYPARTFYIVMPCNMQWALSFLQVFLIPQSWSMAQYTILQMRLTYIMSVVIAIVTPETDDCILPGEFIFYWFNHALLLLLPAAYIANGSVSCYPPSNNNNNIKGTTSTTAPPSTTTFNILWWQFSCALMAVFYFFPVTIMAVYSGLNLNFMLHPPHDHFALKGRWFRLTAVALLALMFGISRLIILSLEKMLRPRTSRSSQKEKSKQS